MLGFFNINIIGFIRWLFQRRTLWLIRKIVAFLLCACFGYFVSRLF